MGEKQEKKLYVEVAGLLIFLIPKMIDLFVIIRESGVEVPGMEEVEARIQRLRELPDLPEGDRQ